MTAKNERINEIRREVNMKLVLGDNEGYQKLIDELHSLGAKL